ncbi:MAG: hypothetical protein Q8O00_04205 [Holophaga sp.]|nr:hypothetical protein [Holophaga sp.]
MDTNNFDEAIQEQAAHGGYLLRDGNGFCVLNRETALERGWTPQVLASSPFIDPGPPAPPELTADSEHQPAISWKAMGLSIPVYLALAFITIFFNPWALEKGLEKGLPLPPGEKRTTTLDLRLDSREALPRSAETKPSKEATEDFSKNIKPGGSFGSRFLAKEDSDFLTAIPDHSGMASLSDLAPTPNPSPAAIQVPARPLFGMGLGRGKGTGEGEGDGIGSGKGKKGGWTRAQLAKMAAEGASMDPKDFVVTRMITPHMSGTDSGLGSVVTVRLLVSAEGFPLFAEAVSGPEHLRAAAVRGALQWGFRLSPRAIAKAPIVVVINFKWTMS